jgi:hypothetical protein
VYDVADGVFLPSSSKAILSVTNCVLSTGYCQDRDELYDHRYSFLEDKKKRQRDGHVVFERNFSRLLLLAQNIGKKLGGQGPDRVFEQN